MQRQSGFTLLELMIVTAIIALGAAAVVPALWNWYPDNQLREAANDVVSVIRRGRLHAVRERAPVCITFDLVGNTLTCFEDSGEGAGGIRNNGIQEGAEATIVTGEAPVGIEMYESTFVADQMRYNTRGLPVGGAAGFGGAIRMRNSRNSYRAVIVSNTGSARVARSTDGGSTWD